jgi:hypothetical protein
MKNMQARSSILHPYVSAVRLSASVFHQRGAPHCRNAECTEFEEGADVVDVERVSEDLLHHIPQTVQSVIACSGCGRPMKNGPRTYAVCEERKRTEEFNCVLVGDFSNVASVTVSTKVEVLRKQRKIEQPIAL